MLEEMNSRMEDLSNAMLGFAQQQNKATEAQNKAIQATKRAEEAEKALNKELVTREEVLKKAFELLGEGGQEVKKFEVFSKKSFDAFIHAGGNAFDFFDLALSTANQRVKIFGVEAALARKVMYGFLPPGMFRLVNKISTSFRFLGGIFRKTSAEGENIDNIFKKMTRGLLSFPKIMEMKKGDFNIFGKIKAGFGEAGRIGRVSKEMNSMISGEKEKIKLARQAQVSGTGTGDEEEIIKAAQKQIELMEEERDRSIEISKLGKFTNKFFKAMKAAPQFLFGAIKFFGKMMLFMGIFLMIAYVLWKTVGKTAIEALEEIRPAIEVMIGFVVASLGMVWEGISSIFNAFFGDGNLEDVIDGVVQIAVGLLSLALSVAGVLFVALGRFIRVFFTLAISKTIAFLEEAFTTWDGFFKALPVILGVVAGVIAFIYGAPIWLAGLAFIILYKIGKWLVGKIKDAFSFNATGGLVNNDMTIVGERGPELVSLPRGSRVHSNSNSKRMAGGSGVVNNFNITINAKDTSKAEMRRIADEIGRMVSSKINRRTSNRSSV
jgi:hypothetical protein